MGEDDDSNAQMSFLGEDVAAKSAQHGPEAADPTRSPARRDFGDFSAERAPPPGSKTIEKHDAASTKTPASSAQSPARTGGRGETRIEKTERKLAELKSQLQALRSREAQKQRREDTRRKIILGGALLDLAERDDAARIMVDRLLRNLSRDQDRSAFDGWVAPGTRTEAAASTIGDSIRDIGA